MGLLLVQGNTGAILGVNWIHILPRNKLETVKRTNPELSHVHTRVKIHCCYFESVQCTSRVSRIEHASLHPPYIHTHLLTHIYTHLIYTHWHTAPLQITAAGSPFISPCSLALVPSVPAPRMAPPLPPSLPPSPLVPSPAPPFRPPTSLFCPPAPPSFRPPRASPRSPSPSLVLPASPGWINPTSRIRAANSAA